MVLFSIPNQIVDWGLEREAKRHLPVVQIECHPRYDDVGYLCYEIGSNVLYKEGALFRRRPDFFHVLKVKRVIRSFPAETKNLRSFEPQVLFVKWCGG